MNIKTNKTPNSHPIHANLLQAEEYDKVVDTDWVLSYSLLSSSVHTHFCTLADIFSFLSLTAPFSEYKVKTSKELVKKTQLVQW